MNLIEKHVADWAPLKCHQCSTIESAWVCSEWRDVRSSKIKHRKMLQSPTEIIIAQNDEYYCNVAHVCVCVRLHCASNHLSICSNRDFNKDKHGIAVVRKSNTHTISKWSTDTGVSLSIHEISIESFWTLRWRRRQILRHEMKHFECGLWQYARKCPEQTKTVWRSLLYFTSIHVHIWPARRAKECGHIVPVPSTNFCWFVLAIVFSKRGKGYFWNIIEKCRLLNQIDVAIHAIIISVSIFACNIFPHAHTQEHSWRRSSGTPEHSFRHYIIIFAYQRRIVDAQLHMVKD